MEGQQQGGTAAAGRRRVAIVSLGKGRWVAVLRYTTETGSMFRLLYGKGHGAVPTPDGKHDSARPAPALLPTALQVL